MKICVVGTGYVGLVSGVCFASTGNDVTCVDLDQKKIERLKDGISPIFEPGLDTLLKNNIASNRIHFTTDLAQGLENAQICFIAVGTPSGSDGSANLEYVFNVARQIAKLSRKDLFVGTKSTVPVGTGDKIEAILKENSNQNFLVFSNPEFLKEGDAVNDFMKPDRIIIGTNDQAAVSVLRELYEPFLRKNDRIYFMKRRSAELAKYAANAMLASRVSFINEMARLADATGADIDDIRAGLGSDTRIGREFLFPGIGYGGSCFPKDVQAILKTAKEYKVDLQVVSGTHKTNQNQHLFLAQKINDYFKEHDFDSKKHIAVWGLAFKANTDDIRESPAIRLIEELLTLGFSVSAFDPQAGENAQKYFGDRIQIVCDPYQALESAHGLVIATEWNVFRSPDYALIKEKINPAVIFDGRNLLIANRVKEHGFDYFGIGR